MGPPTPHPGHATDPGVSSLALLGFECSLDTVPLDTLESVTTRVTRAAIQRWFRQFPATEELAVLSTCHRVEVLALTREAAAQDQWREVLPGPRDGWRGREGRDVVGHLFRVAAGCESLAAGEREVGRQVLSAGRSVLSRHPRPVLRALFAAASRAAAEVGPPGAAPTSIADVAVEHLRRLAVGTGPRVLIVGSGIVGRQVARALAGGARVTILFHERPPDPSFLKATGAEAVRLARLRLELATTDVVVTAAKFGTRGLRASDLPRDRPLVLVDLGMPRNIDPAVRELPNVRLVDLEELYALSRATGRPPRSPERLDERAEQGFQELERSLGAPWIDAILRAAESTRRAELAVARPFLGPLEPQQEIALDRLTRRLVARLLIPPTERIRSLPPGPTGDRQRRDALELLRPADADP